MPISAASQDYCMPVAWFTCYCLMMLYPSHDQDSVLQFYMQWFGTQIKPHHLDCCNVSYVLAYW